MDHFLDKTNLKIVREREIIFIFILRNLATPNTWKDASLQFTIYSHQFSTYRVY